MNSIPYSGGSLNSCSHLFIFLFRSSKFCRFISSQSFIQSLQGFTLCFQPLFPSVWSSFCYRSSSWRFYMMVHQGFHSFSKHSSRFFSEELKHSSSCNPECNCSPLSFEVVIYHSSFTRMRYLNPSLSSLELSWYRFHLKPSFENVAPSGDYLWSKFFLITSMEEAFYLL